MKSAFHEPQPNTGLRLPIWVSAGIAGVTRPEVDSEQKKLLAAPEGLLVLQKPIAYVLVGLLLVYALVRSIVAAEGKTFWYDEMLTLIVSGQGSWRAIVRALHVPVDGQPPLFHWIEHFASGITRNQEIALRLPSIVATPCTLACVFVFVKRRGGELLGLCCAVFLLTTDLFQYYAAEARPYGMVVACVAFAMLCYQRVPSLLWTVLLGMSLALAESLHYLAVLAMIPFGMAEAVALVKTKKVRWNVWAALAAGVAPLLLLWPLLHINKEYYGTHFWAHLRTSELPRMYGEFFMTDSKIGGGMAAVVLVGLVGTTLWRHLSEGSDVAETNKELAERTLLFGLAALPFIGYFLLVRVAHSGMTARYVLSATLGFAGAWGYILIRSTTRTIALLAVFIFSAAGVHELHFWGLYRSYIDEVRSYGRAAESLLASAGHTELRVVVPDGMLLLPLSHYVATPVAERFDYVIEDHLPDDEKWADTVDKGFEALQSYVSVRVGNYPAYISGHREFLVYAERRDWDENWLTKRLRREGWSVQTIASEEYRKVYLVTTNNGKPVEK
jgi:4-amino-4-deoxy-L-arabinose transferase-like glycosyltransferase